MLGVLFQAVIRCQLKCGLFVLDEVVVDILFFFLDDGGAAENASSLGDRRRVDAAGAVGAGYVWEEVARRYVLCT